MEEIPAEMKESMEAAQSRRLQKLSGTLQRVTLHVTQAEHESLSYHCAGESIEALLESFISDLTNSGPQVWAQCHDEAHHWLRSHREGQQVLEILQQQSEGAET